MKRMSMCAVLVLFFASQVAQATTQSPVPSWGLDRIDQRGPQLDGNYSYHYEGTMTIIYVMDSGVADVPELYGRLEHRDYVESIPNDIDDVNSECSAHGTKVATVAAGTNLGVAKNALIVDARVASCPGQNIHPDDFVAALDDIIARHPTGFRGVVNCSFRWQYSWLSEAQRNAVAGAIDRATAAGLTVVVAATDAGAQACTSNTPADLGVRNGVITVSSTNQNDQFVSGAGSGPCVDLLAPTSVAASDHHGSTVPFPGTSASTPLVSGAAAVVLEQNPWMQPGDVEQLLKDNATRYAINYVPSQTANALLFAALPGVGVPVGSVEVGQTRSAWVEPVPGATYSWSVLNGTILGSNTGTTVDFSAGCPPQVRPKVAVSTTGGTSYGYGSIDIRSASAHIIQSSSTTVTHPQSATIYVSLGGTAPWTVQWSDGVQQTFTTSPGTRTVSPTQTTTYRISSVRDGKNCSGTTSGYATITVTGCTPASSTIHAPETIKASATATASVKATTGATYKWTVTNGTIWGGQGTNNLQYIAGCSGTVTVSVTITKSCGTQSQGARSTVIHAPSLQVWGSTAIAAGETATIGATFYGTAPWSITWSDGVRLTSQILSNTYYDVTPSTTTTYTATDFRDKHGCTGAITGSATVTVQ